MTSTSKYSFWERGKDENNLHIFIQFKSNAITYTHIHTIYIYTYMCVHVCVRVYVCVDKECVCGHKNQY